MAVHFRIHGMDCAEDVAVLKREVGPVVGGENRLAFDILRGRMTDSVHTLTAGPVSAAFGAEGLGGARNLPLFALYPVIEAMHAHH